MLNTSPYGEYYESTVNIQKLLHNSDNRNSRFGPLAQRKKEAILDSCELVRPSKLEKSDEAADHPCWDFVGELLIPHWTCSRSPGLCAGAFGGHESERLGGTCSVFFFVSVDLTSLYFILRK